MDENIAGTSGWWMCFLHGRHGLAPANRLKLLPKTITFAGSSNPTVDKNKVIQAESKVNAQDIYHTPNGLRPINSIAYDSINMIYNIPSSPLSTSQSLTQSAPSTEGPEETKVRTSIQKRVMGGFFILFLCLLLKDEGRC